MATALPWAQGHYFVQNGVLHVNQAVAQTLAQQGILVGSNIVTAVAAGQLATAAAALVSGGGLLVAGTALLSGADVDDGAKLDADENLAPVVETSTVSVVENSSGVIATVVASDPEGDPLTFSLSGADASIFEIDSTTGEITLAAGASLDFEAAADADGDNVYSLVVNVDDGNGNTLVQEISIAVQDVNDNAPTWAGSGTANVGENSLVGPSLTLEALGLSVVDADITNEFNFTISGGADQAAFVIDKATGTLSFLAPTDFEGGQTSFQVEITVDDGVHPPVSQMVTINITDENDQAPTWAGAGTFTLNEDDTSTPTVTLADLGLSVTDTDSVGSLSYSISGVDALSFSIDGSTGALTFVSAPDLEGGAKDSYSVEIVVSDVDNPASTLVYSLTGSGADDALFDIDADDGTITFKAAPGYEAPGDVGADHTYNVQVQVSDGVNATDTIDIAISVDDVADQAPEFANTTATVSIDENTTVVDMSGVADYAVTDPDHASGFVYSIVGGADQAAFSIDSGNGNLTLNSNPDFESGKTSYVVQVQVTDPAGLTDTIDVTVNIDDVDDEAPVFLAGANATANVNENIGANQVAYTPIVDDNVGVDRYELSGADAAQFNFDTTSGELSLIANPNHEARDSYSVVITIFDAAGNSASQNVTVNIVDVNEAATSADNSATIDEDTTFTFSASDFAFADIDDGAALAGIKIKTLPSNGDLLLNGSPVSADTLITVADLPNLTYTPALNGFGVAFDSLTFVVNDGGLAGDSVGALDSQDSYTFTFNVNSVADPLLTDPDPLTIIVSDNTSDQILTSNPSPDGNANNYSVTGANSGLFDISSTGDLTWAGGVAPDHAVHGGAPFNIGLRAEFSGDVETQDITIDYSTDENYVGTTGRDIIIGGDQNEALSGGGVEIAVSNHSGQDGDTGWTKTGNAGVETGNPTTVADGDNDDGNYFFVDNGASLSQTLSESYDSSKTYHIVFDETARTTYGNVKMRVKLTAGGVDVIDQVVELSPDDATWRVAHVKGGAGVSGASGPLTVSFETEGGVQATFDNVRVFATEDGVNDGDDTLKGDAGIDMLMGGTGDDVMTGGEGDDMFVFGDDFGKDTITDFDATSDTEIIDFTYSSVFKEFTDVETRMSVGGGANSVIIQDENGNHIILNNTSIFDVDENDFRFEKAESAALFGVGGTELDVVNSSFEDANLTTGQNTTSIAGWSTFTSAGRVFNPAAGSIATVPDGTHAVRLLINDGIQQTLSATYDSSKTYLVFLDFYADGASGQKLTTQVRVGGTNVFSEQRALIRADTWYKMSLETDSSNSSLDGQAITIRSKLTAGFLPVFLDNIRAVEFDKSITDDQILTAGLGDDILVGGAGNDTFTGGAGTDIFYFYDGMGQDVITDFNVNDQLEVLDLSGTGYRNFADLQSFGMAQQGANTFIDFKNGDTLTLENVNTSDLIASRFVFNKGKPVFLDGTTVNASADENIGANQVVHTATALGLGMTYALGGADAASFSIDASTGEVTLLDNPNLATKGSYDFTVIAQDNNGNQTTQSVTLAIDAATVTVWPQSVSFVENSKVGTVIVTLTAGTSNGDGSLTASPFKKVGGTGETLFVLDEQTGEISLPAGSNFDFEGVVNSYTLDVEVTDATGQKAIKTITIGVENATFENVQDTSVSEFSMAQVWDTVLDNIDSSNTNIRGGATVSIMDSLTDVSITQGVDLFDNGEVGDTDILVMFVDSDGLTNGETRFWGGQFYFDSWADVVAGNFVSGLTTINAINFKDSTNLGIEGNLLNFSNPGFARRYQFDADSRTFTSTGANSDTPWHAEERPTGETGADTIELGGIFDGDTLLDDRFSYQQEKFYDFADIDNDGSSEMIVYDASSDTVEVFTRLSTNGLEQYELMENTFFDNVSFKALAQGGINSSGIEAMKFYEFIDTNEDGDLELVIGTVGEVHIYDETWV